MLSARRMISTLVGTKIGMTQVVTERGHAEGVTVLKVGPCVVLQVKTKEADGYDAVQLGFGERKPHRSTLPMIGHAAKAGTGPKRTIREVRLESPAEVTPGTVLTIDVFSTGKVSHVDVTGVSKGKGFAGAMKRHHFAGIGASHGVERKHRSPGSIGGTGHRGTGRGLQKGKKMAGHLGAVRRTNSTLRVVKVDAENDLMLVRGSVPGPNGGVVIVRRAKRRG